MTISYPGGEGEDAGTVTVNSIDGAIGRRSWDDVGALPVAGPSQVQHKIGESSVLTLDEQDGHGRVLDDLPTGPRRPGERHVGPLRTPERTRSARAAGAEVQAGGPAHAWIYES